MLFIRRWLVWLSRIHRVWGFGIQSPTDYAFVRYVVNEHWPYYAYEELTDKDWLTEKLGRLYFRLANCAIGRQDVGKLVLLRMWIPWNWLALKWRIS